MFCFFGLFYFEEPYSASKIAKMASLNWLQKKAQYTNMTANIKKIKAYRHKLLLPLAVSKIS
jgi:hypothetical protein